MQLAVQRLFLQPCPQWAQAFDESVLCLLPSAREGVALAKAEGMDTVIIDTAGRLQIDATLMQELQEVRAARCGYALSHAIRCVSA